MMNCICVLIGFVLGTIFGFLFGSVWVMERIEKIQNKTLNNISR